MKLTVYDPEGKDLGSIDVDDAVFGVEPHKPAMRQALLAALANRRAGTHNTKTRGEVAGSTKKIRRQKGMGAARQGAIRAPHHRHGGIVFGPKSRSYKQSLPKMVRRLAIRSAISAKAAAAVEACSGSEGAAAAINSCDNCLISPSSTLRSPVIFSR